MIYEWIFSANSPRPRTILPHSCKEDRVGNLRRFLGSILYNLVDKPLRLFIYYVFFIPASVLEFHGDLDTVQMITQKEIKWWWTRISSRWYLHVPSYSIDFYVEGPRSFVVSSNVCTFEHFCWGNLTNIWGPEWGSIRTHLD